jgi:hypothetical protein
LGGCPIAAGIVAFGRLAQLEHLLNAPGFTAYFLLLSPHFFKQSHRKRNGRFPLFGDDGMSSYFFEPNAVLC